MANEGSYFSRALLKFVEVLAAGVATAVSGYLIAHMGGLLSATTEHAAAPATVQAAPDVNAAAPLPAKAAAARPAAAAPVRKTATSDSGSAESKSREAESVEAKVRAALAKAEANRPAAHEAAPHPTEHAADVTGSIAPPAVAAPRPVEATAAIPPAPPGADIAPAPQAAPQPGAQAAAPPAPLNTVDIQSRPVADIATAPAAADQAGAPETTQANAGDGQGHNPSPFPDLLAPFKKLPKVLRDDTPMPADEAPRPPMPVGQ